MRRVLEGALTMPRIFKAFVSSTFLDLQGHRAAVIKTLRDAGFFVDPMENWQAESDEPRKFSVERVKDCDLCVLLVALRRGVVPEGSDKSITQMEYEYAFDHGIHVKAFLLNEDAPWPRRFDESHRDPGVQQWRTLLQQRHGTLTFDADPHSVPLAASLTRWMREFSEKEVEERAIAEKGGREAPSSSAPEGGAPLISTEHLQPSQGRLIGRQEVLRKLDDAWADPKTNVACLVGFGGVGKTAILNHWLAKVLPGDDEGVVKRAFAWSFEGQGEDQREASADAFFVQAFERFGEPSPPALPTQRGLRLAELVASERSLLVLDGLEAVMHTRGAHEGKLKDPALQSLLRRLAERNRGLCLVTSWVEIAELAPYRGRTVRVLEVGPLSKEEGTALLRENKVTGAPRDLVAAVAEYRGHALSLSLLGRLLHQWKGGDVRRRNELDLEEPDGARRLVTSYEKLLSPAELSLLRILALFGRPAPKSAIDALRAAPAIEHLTDTESLQGRDALSNAITGLASVGVLIEGRRGAAEATYDCPAIVRDHFAHELRVDHEQAWREANARLYEFHRDRAKAKPETLDEMADLFHAVLHGCRAGMHQRAWAEVYWPRIRREQDGFSVVTLSAWTADLATISNFFERGEWDSPVGLDPLPAANACTEAGFDLRGLGRLEDSLTCYREGLRRHLALGKPWESCDAAGNLAEVLALRGELGQAEAMAQQSIVLARRALEVAKTARETEDAWTTLSTNLATLGEVLHQAGRAREADNHFMDAERELRGADPTKRVLLALRGYHHSDLLLTLGRVDEAAFRAFCIADAGRRAERTYAVGLAHLAMARVHVAQGDVASGGKARQLMDLACAELRRTGHDEMVLRGLLASAALHARAGELSAARAELEEVLDAAARAQMRLLETDAELHMGFLEAREGHAERAAEHRENARIGIAHTGYHRRDAELRALERGGQEPLAPVPSSAARPPAFSSRVPRASSERDTYVEAEQDLVHAYLAGDPIQGTQLGLPGSHDGRLPLLDPDARREWLDGAAATARRLTVVAAREQRLEEVIDADLAETGIRGLRILEETLRPSERNPGVYADATFRSVYALLMREDMDAEQKSAHLLARLREVPALLVQGERRVNRPPRVYVENAAGDVRGGLEFLESELGAFIEALPEGTLRKDLLEARRAALETLSGFARFVDGLAESATDTFALGREAFDALLRDVHRIPYDAASLAELGQDVAARLEGDLERAARRAGGREPWWEVLRRLERTHATRESLLGDYREILGQAREFVRKHDLVDVAPSKVGEIDVLPTPTFARTNLAFAAYIPAPPFAARGRAEFWVTPPSPGITEKAEHEFLRRHHRGRQLVACVHEGYPGHHVQFAHAGHVKRPIRHLFASVVFSEGWGLHCEHLMRSEGFLLDGPDGASLEISMLRDQLWRALRIVIDVGLHCGRLTREAAVRLLVDRHVLDEPTAQAEVMYYCTAPTQPMSYMVGRLLMETLVERCLTDQRNGPTSSGRVRDRILSQGSLPFPLLERAIGMGPETRSGPV